MKHHYLLTLSAIIFTFCTATAQFTDDFETYPLGSYHGTNWSSWSGMSGTEDIIITSAQAYDGTKSGMIGGNMNQDAILRLNNANSGIYGLTFQMYIPTGKSGYMNFQGTLTATGGASGGGIFNSNNLLFNNVMSTSGAAGTGGSYPNVDDPTPTFTWTYPQGAWFPVNIIFDLDNGNWTMSINGTALPPQPFDAEVVLGGIDFFSFDVNNEVYIDAINFQDMLSVDDQVLNAFKAYPNPVTDYLNLSTTSVVELVEVFDILGHRILSIQPETLSPKLDFSELASGSYFVKASMGNQSKTLKIMKQ